MRKVETALESMRGRGSLLVALSGGVDSAVLLALAVEALGADRVVAVTGRSASLPSEDLEDARRVAERLGVRHHVVETFEMERPGYVANAGDRCYHCRTELFEVLARLGGDLGLPGVAYGAIADDAADVRPGMTAAVERGVLAPLADAGLGKEEVREIAEARGLPVHDKPAAACLSSRIPTGSAVTPEKLEQVDRAERGLRAMGFRVFRVRHHGDLARIEVGTEEIDRFLDPAAREAAARAVRRAGFRFAVLDLEGYRPGGGVDALYRIEPARESGQ